jgi:octaheme c-type cytochrome (tetrathionate reductase family)
VLLPENPTPQQVTTECMRCHRFAAEEVMASAHWLWHGASPDTQGIEHRIEYGKNRIVNNYCIDVISNWPRCTSCHVGYGWEDESFDFDAPQNVDCLVCHDTTGTYKKFPTAAGNPVLPQEHPDGREWPPGSGKMIPPVDLVKVAGAVGRPSRHNCGACHFYGGGGDGVKHGDMDSTLVSPPEAHDVHMGRYNMTCQDCHATTAHRIAGGCLAIPAREGRVSCTQCHSDEPHVKNQWLDYHLNDHTEALACQTCHIPVFAKGKPTKMSWDWSQAGLDKPATKDEYGKPTFHKNKGAFTWGKNVRPAYAWYNGMHRRYRLGDKIDPKRMTWLNEPLGDIDDRQAKIFPFKLHVGRQISDPENKHLVLPNLWGGFWKHYDWGKAAEDGMKVAGLPYSGSYEFVDTGMYWGINHEVVPRDRALGCTQCHTANNAVSCTRCHKNVPPAVSATMEELYREMGTADRRPSGMDFERLGYEGDPAVEGGRFKTLPKPILGEPPDE